VPNVHAILVPAGGGGLIAGVAVAVKHAQPSVKIIVRVYGPRSYRLLRCRRLRRKTVPALPTR
jgi:cysteine synthase